MPAPRGGGASGPRIVAGQLGGRRIAAPKGVTTRPTSERVREALFNSLARFVDLEGCRFADLYAGSGAVGIEALSRGAAHVTFVESDPRTARLLRSNLTALSVADAARVVVSSVTAAVAAAAPEPYDVVFADPPYQLPGEELSVVLRRLVSGGWIAPDGVVVVERATRSGALEWVPGLTGSQSRRYGETTLWYGRPS